MTNKALHTITTIAAICLYNTSEKYLLPNGVPCWYLTNIIQKSMHNGLCKIKLKIRKQKKFSLKIMLCVDLRLDRQSVGLWGWEMDTYSLPLQTVKLICNTDNISTGAGTLGRLGHSRDDRCHTCHKIINYFLHFWKNS